MKFVYTIVGPVDPEDAAEGYQDLDAGEIYELEIAEIPVYASLKAAEKDALSDAESEAEAQNEMAKEDGEEGGYWAAVVDDHVAVLNPEGTEYSVFRFIKHELRS